MKNISDIHNCYGCGVCSASCARNLISMRLNKNGFYEPYVTDISRCTNCGICLEVCAYVHNEIALENYQVSAWAAWSNNDKVRKKCSSGGIGFEIGKQLLEQGYKAVGCRYNVAKERAEHFIAITVNEYIQSIGSKYIQSYTEEAFKNINKKEKYLVTGTPCQIDSFRRMIRKYKCEDNFILLDFFCHSVPSILAWKAYLKKYKKQIGQITYASWRNKFEYGWHDSWIIGLNGEKFSEPIINANNSLLEEQPCKIKSRWSQGDLFYKLFLGDLCIGTQCQLNCKYKYNKSSADIRIGDLWGKTYKNDEKGVSALISFTEKGKEIIKNLKDVTLIKHSFEIVAEGQMKHKAKQKIISPIIFWYLRHGGAIESPIFKLLLFSQKVISKIKSMI